MTNWKRKIRGIREATANVYDGKLTRQEALGKIANILKKQPDYKDAEENYDDFFYLVDELTDASQDEEMTQEYFENLLHAVYDWADAEKVWIEIPV